MTCKGPFQPKLYYDSMKMPASLDFFLFFGCVQCTKSVRTGKMKDV